jgi:hypothetical protein
MAKAKCCKALSGRKINNFPESCVPNNIGCTTNEYKELVEDFRGYKLTFAEFPEFSDNCQTRIWTYDTDPNSIPEYQSFGPCGNLDSYAVGSFVYPHYGLFPLSGVNIAHIMGGKVPLDNSSIGNNLGICFSEEKPDVFCSPFIGNYPFFGNCSIPFYSFTRSYMEQGIDSLLSGREFFIPYETKNALFCGGCERSFAQKCFKIDKPIVIKYLKPQVCWSCDEKYSSIDAPVNKPNRFFEDCEKYESSSIEESTLELYPIIRIIINGIGGSLPNLPILSDCFSILSNPFLEINIKIIGFHKITGLEITDPDIPPHNCNNPNTSPFCLPQEIFSNNILEDFSCNTFNICGDPNLYSRLILTSRLIFQTFSGLSYFWDQEFRMLTKRQNSLQTHCVSDYKMDMYYFDAYFKEEPDYIKRFWSAKLLQNNSLPECGNGNGFDFVRSCLVSLAETYDSTESCQDRNVNVTYTGECNQNGLIENFAKIEHVFYSDSQ